MDDNFELDLDLQFDADSGTKNDPVPSATPVEDSTETEDVEEIEEVEYTERDVFIACCGENEDGFCKSVVNIRMSLIDLAIGDESSVEDEIIMDEPIVNIFRSPTTTTVDLTFMPNSFNLVNSVARMQEFMKTENRANDPENLFATIALTITPKGFPVAAYCTGMHGSWYVMPVKIGHPVDTIRFIFNNNAFGTYIFTGGQDGDTGKHAWNEELPERD